ncbi:MAG: hypothetical protein H0U75_05470 [Legionella sp.]|nr:hypothetical protein [Legionella sp.]
MFYKPLTLYYLNQLGITPWINKNQVYSDESNQSIADGSKIIFCNPANQSKQAQFLLKAIMDFIHLLNIEFISITLDPTQMKRDLENFQLHISSSSPLAIINLGVDSNVLKNNLQFDCPLILSPAPEILLTSFLAKKKLLESLLYIQSLHQKICL